MKNWIKNSVNSSIWNSESKINKEFSKETNEKLHKQTQ